MNVTPLTLASARAMRAALRRGGWDEGAAAAAAGGLDPVALRLSGLDQVTLEALVLYCARVGLDILTGDDWAVVAGARSRLSAFARPWLVPPPLAEVATRVGLALPADAPSLWRTARGAIQLDRPVIVGVVNVTPDSFSDGGRLPTLEATVAHAERLVQDGAAVLDVGGESTRPGAEGVSASEERRRVVPAVEAILRALPQVPVSVDTVKADVARAALDAGAAIVNDVSGLRLDRAMAGVAAQGGAGVILMHSRGALTELASYRYAEYGGDVVGGVLEELRDALDGAVTAGIAPETIALDPGFGFGKTVSQNFELLDQLPALAALGRPLLVGPSRKRFLGEATGRDVPQRDLATAAACALAYERGARLFRVHDPASARDALAVAAALRGAPPSSGVPSSGPQST